MRVVGFTEFPIPNLRNIRKRDEFLKPIDFAKGMLYIYFVSLLNLQS